MSAASLGPILYAFFVDHLVAMKGLRPSSIKSYRDAIRLFLGFVAADSRRKVSRLALADLTFERVLSFLQHLEIERGNHIRTRNQRLAVIHEFFDYLAAKDPEMLRVSERVAAIPAKRVAPPETHFLERDEIETLFAGLPQKGRNAHRDRALLLFLYNTGARVQEAADIRVQNLDLGSAPRVRLHGKGDKWRTCPLWEETAHQIRLILQQQGIQDQPESPVFFSRPGQPLTRFGIYKLVRRHTRGLERNPQAPGSRRISPHIFRHTTAVHLLEAGVEVNVIRGWLGHVSLDTTNRYAEINMRAKEAALSACTPPTEASKGFPRRPVWRNDEVLLSWLDSL
ncbi:MAG: tyrosine-type recombinase/integrase [Candidatus Sericytochromatia bacterium]|nr:tyrosine-type recombinase/integrase [Candidatus Sericytochromatia bacterium]